MAGANAHLMLIYNFHQIGENWLRIEWELKFFLAWVLKVRHRPGSASWFFSDFVCICDVYQWVIHIISDFVLSYRVAAGQNNITPRIQALCDEAKM